MPWGGGEPEPPPTRCLWGFVSLPTAPRPYRDISESPSFPSPFMSNIRSCRTQAAPGHPLPPQRPTGRAAMAPGSLPPPVGPGWGCPPAPAATYDGLRVLLQLGLVVRPVCLLQQVRQEALRGQGPRRPSACHPPVTTGTSPRPPAPLAAHLELVGLDVAAAVRVVPSPCLGRSRREPRQVAPHGSLPQ